MAACTSRAAALILRFRSNCRLMRVEPTPLFDVISLTPEDRAQAPLQRRGHAAGHGVGAGAGQEALTEMVGKSTCGSGETGSTKKRAYAGEGQAYGEEDGGYRAADEGFGEVHLFDLRCVGETVRR